ncbi:MAG: alpha-glucan family phosphorylase [Proteobacteria bacterium]|nr:alpha-glucan family phosphorylase [Pseudomonadota bacterium]
MTKQTRAGHPIYSLLPTEIEGFDSLAELALDMRSSWNHATDKIWRQLNTELWDLTQNPWVVLQTVSRDQLEQVLTDPEFRKNIDDLLQAKHQAEEAQAWFQQYHPQASLTCVAYFSLEFMLSEALPIYSGGLGNVAGDQLKAASDLGVPVVGIGLLYQQGYFRQVIDKYGNQQALFPYNDPGQLPITPLRQENGEWLRLEISLPGYSVWLRAWQVQVGRVKLYLLDSNDAANFPVHRGITSELYGGGPELRLKQELLLGIGGWRLLDALGIHPEVCHLNEGHAAFAVLERARSFMQETGQPFEVALAATRAGNLFTTHTAVTAGFDRFAPSLIEQYLGGYAKQRLNITLHDLLALGRRNPNDSSESFNMAYLAIRGSGAVNGVSRLHGKVSRHLFEPLFPNWPANEVPVGYVTNGVHMPSWDSAAADDLWTKACGKDRWLGTMETMEHDIRHVSDADLWQFRIDAGKAHPDDLDGQALIHEWISFIRQPEIRSHIVFLSDYDMLLTEHLVQGVDIWINTPQRPWEACGTSGMKVLVNGGINLSELDGWWAEAYTPEVGWALGDGQEHGEDSAWDAAEADALYDLLEQEVIPEFYTRDDNGIPVAWVARMRESMAQLTPRFSANRTVREYTEQHYLPAASAFLERSANKGAEAMQIVNWRKSLEKLWPTLRFGEMKIQTEDNQHLYEVQVYLNDLNQDAVRVELYADGINGDVPVRQEMKPVRQLTGSLGGHMYGAAVSADRPATDYTARLIPLCSGVAVPLESPQILWQR